VPADAVDPQAIDLRQTFYRVDIERLAFASLLNRRPTSRIRDQADGLAWQLRGDLLSEAESGIDSLHAEHLAIRRKSIQRIRRRNPLALIIEQQNVGNGLLIALFECRSSGHVRLTDQQKNEIGFRGLIFGHDRGLKIRDEEQEQNDGESKSFHRELRSWQLF
jgi:hypothetical protein